MIKISCILTSYNRPRMVRQALKSLADQTYKDFELLIFDDSDPAVLKIWDAVAEFQFPSVQIHHTQLTQEERRAKGRLGVNCNHGLHLAKGDTICFLCDDDYYYPDWFERCAWFFETNLDKRAAFGALSYSKAEEMVFPIHGFGIWWEHPIAAPANHLDHNQVMHRRFSPPFKWPEDFNSSVSPDAAYFEEISKAGHTFYPIQTYAVVKRQHGKNLQNTLEEIGTEKGETIRE